MRGFSQAGWLQDATNWLRDQFKAVWDAFIAFMGDLVLTCVEAVCNFFATVIEAIPVPEWVTSYSLNGMLSQAGQEIAWLVGTFKIGECLSIIGLGYAFRLLRKLFTLGQW